MDNPPEVPIPYRFADPAPRAGRYAFPHAVRASKPGETGDQTYEVEKGRKMTLACKFNVDGMDAADSMDTTALPYLSLRLEPLGRDRGNAWMLAGSQVVRPWNSCPPKVYHG